MDDNAQYCAIVGTNDIKEAETTLRKQEVEWYGENHEEQPIPINDFDSITFKVGQRNGETFYSWSNEITAKDFDDGKFDEVSGFLAPLK